MAGRTLHEPRTVLELLLRQQDRTYDEVAVQFEELARALGERGLSITARHLRRLASGERSGTNPSTRRVLHAMFNLPVDELLRPLNGGPVAVPDGSAACPAPQTESELLEMAADESREFLFGGELPVSGEVIQELHDEVRALANLFIAQPLTAVLPRLKDAQTATFSLLDRRQTPANSRELYFLGSIIEGLLATAANDVAKPGLAMDYARYAHLMAGYTGHDGLRTWIRALQSYICFWAGQPREAIRYAELGAESLPSAHGTAAAWLYAGQARAWASLRNPEQADLFIQRAEAAQEQAAPDDLDEMGGLCTFGRPKYLYYAARALSGLPEQASRAERFSVDAIDAYGDRDQPGWDGTCLSDSQISLALVHASRGELDGAAEQLAPVFALPPEHRIHDLTSTMRLVHGALSQVDSPEATDLQRRIEAFSGSSLPSLQIFG